MLDTYPVTTSFWSGQVDDTDVGLRGRESADVLVVGGGLAGLSTAYHLSAAAPAKRVVLLEARHIGYGASGRNFSNIAQLARSDPASLERFLGSVDARFVVDHQARMFDDFQRLLANERITCEFQAADVLLLALTSNVMDELRELHALHKLYGFPSQLLDRDQTAEFINLQTVGGLTSGRHGYVHPFELCSGLGAAAKRRGATIYERLPRAGRPHGGTVRTDRRRNDARRSVHGGRELPTVRRDSVRVLPAQDKGESARRTDMWIESPLTGTHGPEGRHRPLSAVES